MAKRTLVIGEKAHKSGKKSIRVTKEEWLAEVAWEARVSKEEADKVIKAFINMIEAHVAKKEIVPVPKFGIFFNRHRKAMKTKNIHDGKSVRIKAHELPAFRPSEVFKNLANKKK